MNNDLPAGRPAPHPDVATHSVGGEAVVLSSNEHTVRMFNETATRIWELADGTRTPDEIAAALTTEFEVELPTAQAHTNQFLADLHACGLLVWDNG